MGLADTFQTIVDSLPDDWTDLELDLRLADESRYVDAAVYLDDVQRAALLPPRLALAAARRPPLRPRRLGADRPRHARRCSTTPASRASWSCARCAQGGPRSRRCGAARSRSREEFRARCARSRRLSMARVLALIPDLLFGSQVQGMLDGGGSRGRARRGRWPAYGTLRGRLRWPSSRARGRPHRSDDARRLGARGSARGGGHRWRQTRTLGFYSHVDVAGTRARRAGRLRPRRSPLAHGPREAARHEPGQLSARPSSPA